MPKFAVLLERVVREQATVYIEAESQKDLEGRLHEVYERFDEAMVWEDDMYFGPEEGTHTILREVDPSESIDVSLVSEEVED